MVRNGLIGLILFGLLHTPPNIPTPSAINVCRQPDGVLPRLASRLRHGSYQNFTNAWYASPLTHRNNSRFLGTLPQTTAWLRCGGTGNQARNTKPTHECKQKETAFLSCPHAFFLLMSTCTCLEHNMSGKGNRGITIQNGMRSLTFTPKTRAILYRSFRFGL